MKTLTFRAVGHPKGQPRTRATIRRRKKDKRKLFAGVYDPGTANEWKKAIKAAALKEWDGQAFTGPTRVDWTAFFARPKYHFKRNGELKDNAPKWHTSKPDRDNLDKALLDALVKTGILSDDAIVCSGELFKDWKHPEEQPGMAVRIYSLGH